jgi:restriction system protein
MKNYYRIMLGKKSSHAEEAYKGNFVAAGFIKDKDLTQHLSDNWRDFNKEFIPLFLEQNPGKTKVTAGLACGMLWTVAKGIQMGDIVLCPDGKGNYYVGEVIGGYEYHKGQALPHHRPVHWFTKTLTKDEMSESLKRSAGSIG